MEEILYIQRTTQADKPNANGFTYGAETLDNAMNEAIENKIPICLAPLNDISYVKLSPDEYHYPIGRVIDYDDTTVTALVNSNMDIVKDYVIPNVDKISMLMVYACNVDHETNIVTDMHIKRMDIQVLPETYFD